MQAFSPLFGRLGVPAPGRLFAFITPPDGCRASAALHHPASTAQGTTDLQALCFHNGRCAPFQTCIAVECGKRQGQMLRLRPSRLPFAEIRPLPTIFTSKPFFHFVDNFQHSRFFRRGKFYAQLAGKSAVCDAKCCGQLPERETTPGNSLSNICVCLSQENHLSQFRSMFFHRALSIWHNNVVDFINLL